MLKSCLIKTFTICLFVIFSFVIENDTSLSAPKNNNTKISKNNKNTKKTTKKQNNNSKITKLSKPRTSKIITKDEIRGSHHKTKESNSISLSGYIIDPDSELCEFAEKNDVLRLKKAMADKKYDKYVDQLCKNNESLLLLAVKNDNYLVVKFLLEKGADVNIPNLAGVTPLHMVCRSVKPNADKIFNMLIKVQTLNKNEKDLTGYTPLMRAVEFEKLDFIDTLVKLGADVDVKNDYDESALTLAEKAKSVKKKEDDIKISDKIINILKKKE